LVSPVPEDAEAQLWRLKCSRSEVHGVLTVLRWMPPLSGPQALPTTAKEQFFFFRDVGAAAPAVLLMARALKQPLESVLPLVNCILDPTNPVAHPQPILTGHDLTKTLCLKPGPIIGQLLEQLCIAHAEGQISDRVTALDFVRSLVGQ